MSLSMLSIKVYGLWFMAYGLWFMVYGLWFMVGMVHGLLDVPPDGEADELEHAVH